MTEKKIPPTFSDILNIQCQDEKDDFVLNNNDVKKLLERKSDFLSGKTKSRPWREIKKRYESF